MKTLTQLTVFLCGLLFGTGSSISAKTLFMLNIDGKEFERPLFQTLMMFVGMFLALPIYYLSLYIAKRRRKERTKSERKERSKNGEDTMERKQGNDFEYESLNEPLMAGNDDSIFSEEEENYKLTFKAFMFLAIPSIFDMVATALANFGLVRIKVSIYQLLKCTVIIFVAFAKKAIFKDKFMISWSMWLGIFVNMVAVMCVAATSFIDVGDDSHKKPENRTSVYKLSSKNDESDEFIGVTLVILSCLVQSLQYVYEELIMSSNEEVLETFDVTDEDAASLIRAKQNQSESSLSNIPPMIVVGLEGFWGIIMLLGFVFPFGYESLPESFALLSHSTAAMILTLTYVLVITGYNIFAVYVTFYLDSVWHAILDNFRPMTVWMVQLVLFYSLQDSSFGEQWRRSSWLQLAGLVLLLLGTAIYNQNISFAQIERPRERDRLLSLHSTRLSVSPFISRVKSREHLNYRESYFDDMVRDDMKENEMSDDEA